MTIWKQMVGECLQCVKEPTNEVDKNTVAVVRTNNSHSKEKVVGHVQQNISMIVSMFLSLHHWALNIFHPVKSIQIRSLSWAVSSCIRTECGDLRVNLRIQSEYRKIRTRKISILGHFSRGVFNW